MSSETFGTHSPALSTHPGTGVYRPSMDSEGSQSSQPDTTDQPLWIENIRPLMDELCARQDQLLKRGLGAFQEEQRREFEKMREEQQREFAKLREEQQQEFAKLREEQHQEFGKFGREHQQELKSFRELPIHDVQSGVLAQILPPSPYQTPAIPHPQTTADDGEVLSSSSSPVEFQLTMGKVQEAIEDWSREAIGKLQQRIAALENSHTQKSPGLLDTLLKRKPSSNLKVVDCYSSALLLLTLGMARETRVRLLADSLWCEPVGRAGFSDLEVAVW